MVEEVNSYMIYLIHCKKFCKCHNVLKPSTTIKNYMTLSFILNFKIRRKKSVMKENFTNKTPRVLKVMNIIKYGTCTYGNVMVKPFLCVIKTCQCFKINLKYPYIRVH
jgi:hypothetical protein